MSSDKFLLKVLSALLNITFNIQFKKKKKYYFSRAGVGRLSLTGQTVNILEFAIRSLLHLLSSAL